MSRNTGSVRMGPISLITLVIVMCLAVLTVLTIATAHAGSNVAHKQADFTTDTYTNEIEAQNLMADVDGILATVRTYDGGKEDALAALRDANIAFTPDTREGLNIIIDDETGDISSVDHKSTSISITDDAVEATFVQTSGRCLTITLRINDDATYTLTKWKATTLWDEDAENNALWDPEQNE